MLRPYASAAWLAALISAASPGCSRGPRPDPSAAPADFTPAELAAMRKSVRTLDEYRELVRIKRAERLGSAVVKTKGTPR